jgi:hypothetical protein
MPEWGTSADASVPQLGKEKQTGKNFRSKTPTQKTAAADKSGAGRTPLSLTQRRAKLRMRRNILMLVVGIALLSGTALVLTQMSN